MGCCGHASLLRPLLRKTITMKSDKKNPPKVPSAGECQEQLGAKGRRADAHTRAETCRPRDADRDTQTETHRPRHKGVSRAASAESTGSAESSRKTEPTPASCACALDLRGNVRQCVCSTIIPADGHTASNAPDLFRPPKLSGAGPG